MIWRIVRVTAVVVILGYECVAMWASVTTNSESRPRFRALLRSALALALYGAAGMYDVFVHTVTAE